MVVHCCDGRQSHGGWVAVGGGSCSCLFLALVWLGLGVVGHWIGVVWCCDGEFLLGGIIARNWGVFRAILGNFGLGGVGWLVLGSIRFLVVCNLARRVVGCAVSEWLMTSIGTVILNWGANAG